MVHTMAAQLRSTTITVLAITVLLAGLSLACGGGGAAGQTTQAAESPTLTLSSSSLTFGNEDVQSSSGAQTVTLTNSGTTSAAISEVTVSGSFTQTNNCGSSLAAGSSCTINIVFAPVEAGSASGTLTIADNAINSPQSVTLRGIGVAKPQVTLSHSGLTFLSQPVGTSSSPQNVSLQNTGRASLTMSSISVTGANSADFTQANTCPGSVAVGAQCTISVSFKPSASGSRTATLAIVDNAGNSPQSVSLVGTSTGATAPAVSLSPTSLSFSSQTVGSSTSQAVTLSNTGNASLSLASVTVTGANSSDFTQTNTCGTAIAAAGKCTITVVFKPSASGNRSATLTIADNAGSSPQSVVLAGTGGTAASVSLSPTSLSFGSEFVELTASPQTVTLKNTGGGTLTLTPSIAGTNAGDFTESNTCGSSVAAGAQCTFALTFQPLAAGSRTAALTITDNASGSPQTVALTGTGSHDVILSWNASATTGIAGYDVYRRTASTTYSTPLNSTPLEAESYTDESVTAGTTYYYVVKTVASDGVTVSTASAETSAAVPSP